MARTQIFEGIFGELRTNTALITLLGSVTPMNQRLYRSWSQFVNFLSTYEPQPSEGWLVFHEEKLYLRSESGNWETTYEFLEPMFTVVATRYSLADDVIDLLDQLWQWSVFQQRDVQYGERILLFSRRFNVAETYTKEIKLPTKTIQYRQQYVLEMQPA